MFHPWPIPYCHKCTQPLLHSLASVITREVSPYMLAGKHSLGSCRTRSDATRFQQLHQRILVGLEQPWPADRLQVADPALGEVAATGGDQEGRLLAGIIERTAPRR